MGNIGSHLDLTSGRRRHQAECRNGWVLAKLLGWTEVCAERLSRQAHPKQPAQFSAPFRMTEKLSFLTELPSRMIEYRLPRRYPDETIPSCAQIVDFARHFRKSVGQLGSEEVCQHPSCNVLLLGRA